MKIDAKAKTKQLWKNVAEQFYDPSIKGMLIKSCVLIVASKGLAIASPLALKFVVDAMAAAQAYDFHYACYGIGVFGAARFASTALAEYRMIQVQHIIQEGIKRLSMKSFRHLHNLDLNFHRTSSKNTVFGVNRALRSVEETLRFSLGFFVPIACEFFLLCGMLQLYCGSQYLANMLVTLGLYTYYTRSVSI